MDQRARIIPPPRRYDMLDKEEARIFSTWLQALNATGIGYVVGGAFALYAHTGLWRDTKDLDVFLRPADVRTALAAFEGRERTVIHDVHWLAKVLRGPHLMDMIFAVSNENVPIDESWFEFGLPVEILNVPTRVAAAEEVLASKAFVVRHDRFDGGDIAHIIRAAGGRLDWDRVLARMAGDRDLLFWYLVLYRYVYPAHAGDVPDALFDEMGRPYREGLAPGAAPFRGTLIDPDTFRPDVEQWGYPDPRRARELVDGTGRAL